MESWQFTPQALLPLVATLAAAGAGLQVWPRRRYPTAEWVVTMLWAAAWWSAMTTLEYSAKAEAAKVLWSQLSYAGIELAPLAAWRFAYSYTRGGASPQGVLRWGVDLWAGFMVLATFTNDWHHLVWTKTGLIHVGGYVHGWYERGPFFWANVVCIYSLMAWSAGALAHHAWVNHGVLRRQGLIVLGALMMPWATSGLYMLRLGEWGRIDHTPVGFAASGVILAWGVWRFRLLELLPVARQTLFECMVDPVLVVENDIQLVLANPAARSHFGFASELGEGTLAQELATHPALLSALARRVPNQTVEDNGTWWDVQMTPLGSRGQRLFVLRDITERQRAIEAAEAARRQADLSAQEARAANAAKSSFLAQVSHDLRTPLHAILGLSEIWQRGDTSPEVRSAAVTIHDAGESLVRLVDDLLDLSKIEAGKLELFHEPFALADVLVPVERLLRVVAERKGITLHQVCADPTPEWWVGDADRVRQILLNLVGNAVKFTDTGAVHVRVSSQQDQLHIEVEDTGPGIPPDKIKTIFDPFSRGDLAQVRRTQGTGLGLAIVRKLAEAMRGSVNLRSEVGKGSCFTVDLPLPVTAKPGSRSTEVSPAAAAPRQKERRVLLADDDPLSRTVTQVQLQRCGCLVTTVNDGAAVFPEVCKTPFDLIVLDGQMPEVDGWEVAARLDAHACAGGRRPGIVALSADLSPTTLERWHQARVAAVISKPATLGDIERALAAAAASSTS